MNIDLPEIEAFDVYRVGPSAEVRTTLIAKISPSSKPEVYATLAEQPWKYRTNLTGYTVRCTSASVSTAFLYEYLLD